MERRDFIITSCGICLAGSAIGTLLSSCAPIPTYTTKVEQGTISVPFSVFHSGDIQIIHAQDTLYDIALKKEANGGFTAFALLCTHASNPLAFTGDKFICSLHGSKFDQEGKVIHGPATRPLDRLATRLTSDGILISL
jgi:Rieske Fe-S protein